MGAGEVLMLMAIMCAVSGVAAAVLITVALDRRGLRTPFPAMGFFLYRNLGRYRTITIEESGHAGPLYRVYVTSMVAALVLALLGLALRAQG